MKIALPREHGSWYISPAAYHATWNGVWELRTMPPLVEVLAVVAIFAIQLAGAASVVHTRLKERSLAAARSQKWFFILLLAVGLATMIGIQTGHSTWLSGAATLGLMAIGGTVDFRTERRSPAY